MKRYEETAGTWNKIASAYQEKFMHLDLYNSTYDSICETITKENARLLEVGCGPGNITKYLLSKRPDLNILGIDVAPNMIGLAKKNNPSANFEVMRCQQISELPIKYDGVIAGFCIPYISEEDCEKLIADSFNLLKENGLLYLSFVEGNPENSGFQSNSAGDRIFFNFYRLQELTNIVSKRGFKDIQVSKVEYSNSENSTEFHTILTAIKPSLS